MGRRRKLVHKPKINVAVYEQTWEKINQWKRHKETQCDVIDRALMSGATKQAIIEERDYFHKEFDNLQFIYDDTVKTDSNRIHMLESQLEESKRREIILNSRIKELEEKLLQSDKNVNIHFNH